MLNGPKGVEDLKEGESLEEMGMTSVMSVVREVILQEIVGIDAEEVLVEGDIVLEEEEVLVLDQEVQERRDLDLDLEVVQDQEVLENKEVDLVLEAQRRVKEVEVEVEALKKRVHEAGKRGSLSMAHCLSCF